MIRVASGMAKVLLWPRRESGASARSKQRGPAEQAAALKRSEAHYRLVRDAAEDAQPDFALTNEYRMLFRRLAVFVGGCTLESAEAVCNTRGDLKIDVLDGVALLVDKNLLQQEGREEGGEPRFAMLETIREYALAQLEASGEAESVRRKHATFFLALAERADPELTGPEQKAWLERLETEHGNLRTVFWWSLDASDGEVGLRLAATLGRFWEVYSHFTDGRRCLGAALAATPGVATSVRVSALRWAGALALRQGDYHAARRLLQEGLALGRALGDRRGIAAALNLLGIAASEEADHEAARALYAESLAIRREMGDQRAIADSLNNLGVEAYYEGDYTTANTLHAESLAIRRELGDQAGVAHSLGNLADAARQQGDYGRATVLYAETLALFAELSDKPKSAFCLEGLAAVAGAQGQSARSVRLFGAAAALREALGAPLPPADRADYDTSVADLRTQLGEKAFVAAWVEGSAMNLEQAVAYGLGKASTFRQESHSEGVIPLTPGSASAGVTSEVHLGA